MCKKIIYDPELNIEAYEFAGRVQPFPNHFHEYYVIGIVEKGARHLSCKNKSYNIAPGDLVLFNPGDTHACTQKNSDAFAYRALNITPSIMGKFTQKIIGTSMLPYFTPHVIEDTESTCQLRILHSLLMQRVAGFSKEKQLLLFLAALIQKYAQPCADETAKCQVKVSHACTFMQKHFAEHLTLDAICQYAALSKSTLLRAFIQSKGITPYRYLESLRINAAKNLLVQGAQPAAIAIQTGFADQSHFTNAFNSFFGITPGVYREIFLRKARTTKP